MAARIPEGMSSVDAFEALYRNAKVTGMGHNAPSFGEPPRSPWNAIQIFKNYCHHGFCDNVRGKLMKVDFRKFPELDVNDYDNHYGQGSAQKALDTYQRTMDKSDSAGYDLNCEPCTYFTSYWKQQTPEHHRKDLNEMFRKCERLEKLKKMNLDECTAKYALV